MLIGLSVRNAKRQSREYLLYFITLACSVSFIYAFNTLIFSDLITDLPDLEILPYMIIVASILIVLIMGWIIGYMTNYMLKRRSRELSIYMLSGISNRSISTLVLFENFLIGTIAFVLGLPVGFFFISTVRCHYCKYVQYNLQTGFFIFFIRCWTFTDLFFLHAVICC